VFWLSLAKETLVVGKLTNGHTDSVALDRALCLDKDTSGCIEEIGEQRASLARGKNSVAEDFMTVTKEMRLERQH